MKKLYKNGNLHIRLTFEHLKEVKKHDNIIEVLTDFEYDLIPVSDSYCMSNYTEAFDVEFNGGYSYYTVTDYDLIKLQEGKTSILKPLDDDYVQEFIVND